MMMKYYKILNKYIFQMIMLLMIQLTMKLESLIRLYHYLNKDNRDLSRYSQVIDKL